VDGRSCHRRIHGERPRERRAVPVVGGERCGQRRPQWVVPAEAGAEAGASDDEDTLELDEIATGGENLGEDEDDDELLLGADDVLTSPVGSPPIAPPADEDDEGEAPTAGVVAGGAGGTLFERMSNIARGAPKAQIDEEDGGFESDPIDIPRFLNRQNNQ